jgi:hypothetical protein
LSLNNDSVTLIRCPSHWFIFSPFLCPFNFIQIVYHKPSFSSLSVVCKYFQLPCPSVYPYQLPDLTQTSPITCFHSKSWFKFSWENQTLRNNSIIGNSWGQPPNEPSSVSKYHVEFLCWVKTQLHRERLILYHLQSPNILKLPLPTIISTKLPAFPSLLLSGGASLFWLPCFHRRSRCLLCPCFSRHSLQLLQLSLYSLSGFVPAAFIHVMV